MQENYLRQFCFRLILLLGIIAIFISCEKKEILEEYFPETSLAFEVNTESGFLNSDSLDLTPEIFVQMGHVSGAFGYTNAVEFLPGGKYILTGNGDGTVKLWETETGREVKTFRCDDDVSHIDVSSDGKYFVSGDMNFVKNINIWDVSSGKIIRTFQSRNSCNGYPALFCNNDQDILVGGGDEKISLWNIRSGEPLREYLVNSEHDSARIKPDVSALAVTPDGKKIISGYRYNASDHLRSSDHTIRVWDFETGEQINAFNNTGGWIETLSIMPDGESVISGDWEQDSVRVWDISTGNQIKAYPGHTSTIDISAKGRYALFGGCMSFRLVELATGKLIRRIDKNIDGWVRSIRFSPDGKYALVGDDTSKPKLWNLETGEIVKEYGGYTSQLQNIKLSRTGDIMIAADDYNDLINLWDYKNGRMIKTVARDSGSIMSSATISDDGTLMATGGWNGRTSNAIIWDVKTSEKLVKMELDEEIGSHTEFIQFSEDNKYLVWASQNRFTISEVRTGKKIKTIHDSLSCFNNFFINSKTGNLIVDMRDGPPRIYSLKNGEFISRIRTRDETGSFHLILGNEYLYEFSEFKDKDGWKERFFTVYDLNTIEVIKREKIRDGYFFSDGIVYNSNILFSSWYHGGIIDKYDLKSFKSINRINGHEASITNLEITPDNKFLCSGSRDGTVKFWDTETGKEIAQFIAFTDGEWIVMTPEGYFNASPNGAKYINVRIGNQVYSIDNFYEKYYDPAYVASVLQGKDVRPVADIRDGVALPPEVRIVSPETNTEVKSEEVTITISAKDMGGGIDEIRLYHNGKAVGEDTRGVKIVPKVDISTKDYTITLVDGTNNFRAVGYSRDRTESNPSEIVIKLLAPEKDISLFVLSVGINEYKNPALNLNYAEPDAKAIVDFFRRSGDDLFKTSEIREIYNGQATKIKILSLLKELESSSPQDVVLIYLAGHGENINEKWYFIPHELTYPEREEDVIAKAISSDELSNSIKNIKAQKILVLIDACKSGAALLAFRGFEDRKALSQLSRATGVHVVAASSKDQFAAEVKDLGHGVFTYTLLDGLNGKAASKGENVTVRKLMLYIDEQLPELTKKYRQEAQYPVVDSKGMDFPLVKGR